MLPLFFGGVVTWPGFLLTGEGFRGRGSGGGRGWGDGGYRPVAVWSGGHAVTWRVRHQRDEQVLGLLILSHFVLSILLLLYCNRQYAIIVIVIIVPVIRKYYLEVLFMYFVVYYDTKYSSICFCIVVTIHMHNYCCIILLQLIYFLLFVYLFIHLIIVSIVPAGVPQRHQRVEQVLYIELSAHIYQYILFIHSCL